ncbi:MAG: FHA domain-containing protein [Deltaproteobacteria bacterium]|nr:FHA domain-containing protein [Deltaproteobacteria bacterium]
MSGQKLCPQCNTPIAPGFKFCGNCGFNIGDAEPAQPKAKTMYFGAFQVPGRARLVLIKGSGQDGTTYYLTGQEHIIGRTEGQIRSEQPDPLLSPRHANFYYEDGNLFVKDENSTNGVFVRIKGSINIEPGDVFMIGRMLFRLDLPSDYNEQVAESDGTYFYFTPHLPAAFLLTRILQGGIDGDVYRAEQDVITLGREGNTKDFPSEPFISGSHARINYSSDGFTLTDMDSRNGTFYRIKDRKMLTHGDFVFMGTQLFRVEIT